ncbi:MAG: serine hydrolase, partial [Acidithiobacillus sp.]|nr:serine hydrolase [Acidithiobacillus sp.]
MISPKHILLSTLVLSCVAAGVSAQASALSGLSGVSGFHNTASMYTQFIAEHLQKAEVPGAIVGIWQSGRPVYLQAFGTANSAEKTAMSVRMNMPIGQLSTAFTVRAVLDLAKADKIQLSAPVSRYVSGVPDGEHMTVADLAQMRSGLVDFSKQAAYLDAIQKNPEARLLPDQLLHYSFTHP